MNYFVPNFGMDADIKDSFSNLDNAEESLDHKMTVAKKKEKASLAQADYGAVDSDIMSV